MDALLDTHVFLWMLREPERISPAATALIEDRSNRLFLSAASVWEMSIKTAAGKLRFSGAVSRVVPEQMATLSVSPLAVQISHAALAGELPPHHRDPFDRMLLAQAQLEELPLLSADPQLQPYGVPILW